METRKVVINDCYGGFGISKEATEFMGLEWDGYGHGGNISRDDPKLVEAVEQLGEKANGNYAKLKIVEIPADVEWDIQEYDGSEWIAEKHRTWG